MPHAYQINFGIWEALQVNHWLQGTRFWWGIRRWNYRSPTNLNFNINWTLVWIRVWIVSSFECLEGGRSWGRSTCYFDRLHDLSVTIPWCHKDVYVNSFFPCTARLWNSLPIKCFPLTFDLSGFKSRINRHLFYRFPVCCNLSQWLFSLTWSESQWKKKDKFHKF